MEYKNGLTIKGMDVSLTNENYEIDESIGFELQKHKDDDRKLSHDIIPKKDSDGGTNVDWYNEGYSAAGATSQVYDVDFINFDSERELINQYRFVSTIPEVDEAIENIITESIISDEFKKSIEIILDEVEDIGDSTKDKIAETFDEVYKLLNFSTESYNIFRRWYVDGKLAYQMLIDKNNPKNGIAELRYLDAAKIQKVRKAIKKKEIIDGQPIETISGYKESFIYDLSDESNDQGSVVEFNTDAICYATSGIIGNNGRVLSHLHKAVRVSNQLRLLENSMVIYRLSRAPERRIFYIDVGNLPTSKANEYVNNISNKFKNKVKYNSSTGNVSNVSDVMSIMEDYYLPRREGGKGTEVTTLPGGSNLGEIEDILYFQKKLFKSLNVPISRLLEDSTFSFGRSSEISRDEVKFNRFIERIRKRFTKLFLELLKTQLLLKEVITKQEWQDIRDDIHFDFLHDTYFSELKDLEILQERLQIFQQISEYTGTYFSREYIKKKILRQSDEEIKEINKQIEDDKKEDEKNNTDDDLDFDEKNNSFSDSLNDDLKID